MLSMHKNAGHYNGRWMATLCIPAIKKRCIQIESKHYEIALQPVYVVANGAPHSNNHFALISTPFDPDSGSCSCSCSGFGVGCLFAHWLACVSTVERMHFKLPAITLRV